jgi:hypothetical protein
LVYKGVVFNEMKGALVCSDGASVLMRLSVSLTNSHLRCCRQGDAASLFYEHLQNQTFPTTTYHHCSGGLPTEIPNLTYEQLKHFHATHYHPSNARFFTYGSTLDLPSVLKAIDHEISPFGRLAADKLAEVDVDDVARYSEPRIANVTGPVTPGRDISEQFITATCFLCSNVTNVHRTFELAILGALLLSGPNAPLHQALIQSNIGQVLIGLQPRYRPVCSAALIRPCPSIESGLLAWHGIQQPHARDHVFRRASGFEERGCSQSAGDYHQNAAGRHARAIRAGAYRWHLAPDRTVREEHQRCVGATHSARTNDAGKCR